MDVTAFELFQHRFPGETWARAVYCKEPHPGDSEATSPTERTAWISRRLHLDPNASARARLASFVAHEFDAPLPDVGASAEIVTPYGGTLLIVQRFASWTATSRRRILDGLDAATSGMVARLVTGGYAVAVLPRIALADGRTAGTALLNLSIGITDRLTLDVRRPSGTSFRLLRPCRTEVKLRARILEDGTARLLLPSIEAWGTAVVICE